MSTENSLVEISDTLNNKEDGLFEAAKRGMKMCWDLDENDGEIALDTYIINFNYGDNASHLDDILKKVPVERFIERLKVMDNDEFLGRNFMGTVDKMQESIIAFIDAINEACNLNLKFKDSIDSYEFDLCFETIQEMYDSVQTPEEVKTNFMDVYNIMVKEILAANYKIAPEREDEIILKNTYFKILKDGEPFTGLTFETINALCTTNEGKGYDAFTSGMAKFIEEDGCNGGRVYFEFPKDEDLTDKQEEK